MATPGFSLTPTPLGPEDNLEVLIRFRRNTIWRLHQCFGCDVLFVVSSRRVRCELSSQRWPSDLSHICHEKLALNKKSNLERHFTTKQTQFVSKYPADEERKKAVDELQKQQSSSILSNWTQSTNNVNLASFAVSLEIAKKGKPFTDSEYVNDCFIRASEELFRDFKNKSEISEKIKDLPLSAKTIR
ncbi:uncharacterized protein TNCV_2933231 [Trichonephila clavipes]|nr:uncharacterized protein TNCV_2933231 [Trichonephila clavipes]